MSALETSQSFTNSLTNSLEDVVVEDDENVVIDVLSQESEE